jgi:hypothetical protein
MGTSWATHVRKRRPHTGSYAFARPARRWQHLVRVLRGTAAMLLHSEEDRHSLATPEAVHKERFSFTQSCTLFCLMQPLKSFMQRVYVVPSPSFIKSFRGEGWLLFGQASSQVKSRWREMLSLHLSGHAEELHADGQGMRLMLRYKPTGYLKPCANTVTQVPCAVRGCC